MVGKVWQFLKQIWQFLKENRKYGFRILWRFIKGPKSRKSDKFWEENAYSIIRISRALGVVALLIAVLLSTPPGSDSEIVRNVYYFLIFIGAGIAASIATWRGRQFERQLQNSRFEKAIDMATDLTSEIRRGSGFRILEQMLSSWRGNFDDVTGKRIDILNYLVFDNFMMAVDTRKSFHELYKVCKVRYGKEEDRITELLYDKTHRPNIDIVALNLWKEIISWSRSQWDDPVVAGIYAPKTTSNISHCFIFSGVSFEKLKFFVERERGRIKSPTRHTPVNFKRNCFLAVDMNGADVSYVDFSKSHLFRVNFINDTADCNMKCIGTIFDEANLILCNFRGANFKDASFDRTNISCSDFSHAKNLIPEQFQQGAYWIKPGMPQFPSNFPLGFADTLPNQAPPMSQKW